MSHTTKSFCIKCGHPMDFTVPDGDNHHRFVCSQCGFILYKNPKNIVLTIPVWEDQVLLCQRGIDPGYGLWTLPGGYQECHESSLEGARRETYEEAGVDVDELKLFQIVEMPHHSQSWIYYVAQIRQPIFYPGPETIEARLVPIEKVADYQFAFRNVRFALDHYIDDIRRLNRLEFHHDILNRHSNGQ